MLNFGFFFGDRNFCDDHLYLSLPRCQKLSRRQKLFELSAASRNVLLGKSRDSFCQPVPFWNKAAWKRHSSMGKETSWWMSADTSRKKGGSDTVRFSISLIEEYEFDHRSTHFDMKLSAALWLNDMLTMVFKTCAVPVLFRSMWHCCRFAVRWKCFSPLSFVILLQCVLRN